MKVIKSDKLSKHDTRYIIVDDTGKVLDDAQGYGYKSAQKAHAAWAYKNRTPSQIKKAKDKKQKVQKWIKEHKEFMSNLEWEFIDYLKNGEELDNQTIRKWMIQEDPNVDFTVHDLLKEC